jgi:hypothetical protein
VWLVINALTCTEKSNAKVTSYDRIQANIFFKGLFEWSLTLNEKNEGIDL